VNLHPIVHRLFTIMRECPGMSSGTVDDAGSGTDGRLCGEALLARAAQALAVPLQHALGARLRDPADPGRGVVLPVTGLAGNGVGGLHSGALSAVLELAAYLALLPELGAREHAVTHAIATQLVAAARDGEEVLVVGALERRTRRLAFVGAAASVGDRLVARAQITKSVVPLA
jgi:acyl-coenzyme A thioesterase PaaI-like protein